MQNNDDETAQHQISNIGQASVAVALGSGMLPPQDYGLETP